MNSNQSAGALKTLFNNKTGYNSLISITDNNQFAHKSYVDNATVTKLPLAGGIMTGTLNMNSNNISNLPDPTMSYHPVTLSYLQTNNYTKTQTDATSVNTSRLVVNNNLDFGTLYCPLSSVTPSTVH